MSGAAHGRTGRLRRAPVRAKRRELAHVAQPDFQAQLAEESFGERYFAVFEPLDIETWNDGHAAVAALVRTGLVCAVVTTNFDRLIELALEAAGVKPTVYSSPEEFERLSQGLKGRPRKTAVPVIKVHGTVGRLSTMVDTLRQRVLGRPKELEAALLRLFTDHAVLVVGFSGADLEWDSQYLSLAAGAAGSPSFTVVNREGGEPREELVKLVAEAGPRARIVDGSLPESLVEVVRTLAESDGLVQPEFDTEMEFPGMRSAGLPADVYFAWGESLSPVRAAVVLASIAEAAGSSDAAFQTVIRAMPYHVQAGLQDDPAMPKHLCMIARGLIEACLVDDDLSAEVVKGGPTALSVLSASVNGKPLVDPESLALRALTLALCGEAALADGTGMAALEATHEEFVPIVRADTICALARAWTLDERWLPPCLVALRETYELMFDWGDEPRRARVAALYVRFLGEAGEFDEAAAILQACRAILERVDLPIPGNELVAAGGRLYLWEGNHERAMSALTSACRHFESGRHWLSLAETLLPLAEAAAATGDTDTLGGGGHAGQETAPARPGPGPAPRGEYRALDVHARRVRRGPRRRPEPARVRRALRRPPVGPCPGRPPRAADRRCCGLVTDEGDAESSESAPPRGPHRRDASGATRPSR